MKTVIRMLTILLIILFTLSSCNDVFPANNPTESNSEIENLPKLSKEELENIKMKVSAHLNAGSIKSLTQETYLKDRDWYKDDLKQMPLDMIYAQIAATPDNDMYLEADITLQLREGMLLGDVTALLGTPHFNMRFMDSATSDGNGRRMYDYFTFYILEDGRIMEIRYVPVFIGDEHTREEFASIIPHFDVYEEYPKNRSSMRWGKIGGVKLLSLNDFCAQKYDAEYALTESQDIPSPADIEKLRSIQVGMTYEEVKSMVGVSGMDLGKQNNEFRYLWNYEVSDSIFERFDVTFVLNDSGALIVSKIGT